MTSPLAVPSGTRPDAMAPAIVPRKNGVITDESANAAPKMRRSHSSLSALRNANAEPRKMMPSAAAVSGMYNVDAMAAKTAGNPVQIGRASWREREEVGESGGGVRK